MEGFAVPLVARGQRLGTLAVGRHQRHRHDADEVAVLEDVARRAALAIENARIHAERRRVAQTLQQSLLPPALPVVDGIGFAAEYVPTGDDAEVGGDFYDVVPLPRRPLARGGRRRLRQGDRGGGGHRAGPGRHPGAGRPTASRCRRCWPGSTRRWSSGAAGATARWPWRRSGPATDGGLDVALHLAGHDRPVLLRAGGGASFVGIGGTALGLLDSITSPTAPRSRSPPATR